MKKKEDIYRKEIRNATKEVLDFTDAELKIVFGDTINTFFNSFNFLVGTSLTRYNQILLFIEEANLSKEMIDEINEKIENIKTMFNKVTNTKVSGENNDKTKT